MLCYLFTSRWTGYGLSIPGNLTIPGRSVIGQLTKVRHVLLSFRLDAIFLLGQWSVTAYFFFSQVHGLCLVCTVDCWVFSDFWINTRSLLYNTLSIRIVGNPIIYCSNMVCLGQDSLTVHPSSGWFDFRIFLFLDWLPPLK